MAIVLGGSFPHFNLAANRILLNTAYVIPSLTHFFLKLRKEKRELEETLESEQLSQVTHLQKKILKLESEVVRKQEALMEVHVILGGGSRDF